MPGYHIENFGCRATQADGATLERQFVARGLVRATANDAEIVVLNTCTVTAAADQDARAAIRRVRRQNPNARIVVTGCYAQRAPEEIAALPGVDCVVGNSHKLRLAEIALEFAHHDSGGEAPAVPGVSFVPLRMLAASGKRAATGDPSSIFVSDIFAHTELVAARGFDAAGPDASARTRPNLKVQDGCDNRCSFCVIPSVRGPSRSLPIEGVIGEVNALVDLGYRELVISGINLGRWGRDFSGTSASRFEELVRAILQDTLLEKLRISSVEPMDWSDELIALVATTPRIAKHAHVPLQSGSDAVLRRMHRKYRPWHYREKIERIHAAMPTAAIGADVMTGFPGETDAEFEQTRRMIEELPLTYLHVFTYSPRPGTPAAEMGRHVPVQIARERNRVLRDLAREKKAAFMRSFVGKTIEAITLNLVHSDSDGEFTEALTDNYQKLKLSGSHPANRWVKAQVHCLENETFVGTASEPDQALGFAIGTASAPSTRVSI